MSDHETWITPSQAIQEIVGKLPHAEADTLIYWARDNKIQIKCHEVSCSDDSGLSMYIADNLPSDFWRYAVNNAITNWTVGEMTVQIEIDDGVFEHWTASGLKIELAGLRQAINIEIGKPDKTPFRAAKGWHIRTPTAAQKQLFVFFDHAGKHLRGGNEEVSLTRLHKIYINEFLMGDPKDRALKRSAFETWLRRYQQGWRVSKNRWHESD